jgi:hypothetical protein
MSWAAILSANDLPRTFGPQWSHDGSSLNL